MQGTISMHSTSNLASISRCKPVIVHLDTPVVLPRIQSQPSQRCSCSVQASAGRPWQARTRNRTIAKASVPSFMSLPSVEGYIEVLALKGIRVVLEDEVPTVQYLVEWKDGSEPTWEKAGDLSPDLIRDYEEKWWSAVKKAEFDVMADMLAGGKDVLAHAVDENRRSALHFAAALGKEDAVKLLLEAGADPNLQDTQGYTPLHMAAGYMHTTTMSVLLAGGSDPQLRDSTGKDVVSLLEGLRTNMPLNLGTVMQRLRLEDVANALTDLLYDEVEALAIIDERRLSDGTREVLVSWADGREDSWVAERDVSASLLQDWLDGMESARAQAITDMVQVGTERRFKIKWADNYPDSWEPEEHVSPSLIELFKQQNPRLFEERVAAAGAILPSTAGRGGLSAQASSTSSQADATPEEAAVPLMLDNLAMQQHMEAQQQQQQQQEADGRVLATSA